MDIKFKFDHVTYNDVVLECVATYPFSQHQPDEVELNDVMMGKDSVIDIIHPDILKEVNSMCLEKAIEHWEDCCCTAKDERKMRA